MNFVSAEFLWFFLIVLVGLCVLHRSASLRGPFLLCANLWFYAVTGVMALPVLITSAFINWGCGAVLAKASLEAYKKRFFIAACIANLALLALFKYYEFFYLSLTELAATFSFQLVVPSFLEHMVFLSGVSFYTFQGISYCVEQYRNPEQPPQSFFRVLAYLSFFPTVLAGPILRPAQFFPQFERFCAGKTPVLTESSFSQQEIIIRATAFILSGLFKKVVLASYLSEKVVYDVFQGPEGYSSWGVLVGVYGYAIQIFCDFSGYTDLAIGIALLLGFTLPQNFNAPYLACNLQDFWRRWHITLSTWLRDYLYIPLGGSRRGNLYVNLFLTMLLGGLWHGAHTRFLVWGALHGAGLMVVHALGKRQTKESPSLMLSANSALLAWRVFSWLLTFHFVAFAWIFFRAEDMDTAIEIIRRIIFWGQGGDGFPVMALPILVAGIAVQIWGKKLFAYYLLLQHKMHWVVQVIIVAILIVAIRRMGPDGVLPFIYFQF